MLGQTISVYCKGKRYSKEGHFWKQSGSRQDETVITNETLSYQSGSNDDSSLLGCYAVSTGKQLTAAIQSRVAPPPESSTRHDIRY